MTEPTELPDTAMATGNDEGEPGEQRDAGPLAEDERKLLEQLRKPTDDPAAPALEDSPEVAAAVAEDSPVPGAGEGSNDDGLDAEFTDR